MLPKFGMYQPPRSFKYEPRRLLRGVLDRIRAKDRRWFLLHKLAKWRFARLLKRVFPSAWLRPVDAGPPWTPEIQMTTSLMFPQSAESLARYPPDRFYYRAYKDVTAFLSVLERHSFNFRTAGAILELGCGSARLLRLLRCIEGVRLVGADINPACVEWCKGNVSGPEYYVNQAVPPLAFARAGTFDLVWAYSVFTHIPSELQRAWLEEIRRVLRTGGIFLCTVIGQKHGQHQLSGEDYQTLAQNGELMLHSDCPRISYSSKLRDLCDIYYTRHRAIENFGHVFELIDFLPGQSLSMGQDLLVLRKPTVSTTLLDASSGASR